MSEVGSISVTGFGTRAGDRARIVLDIDIPPNCHIEAHEPADPFLIPTVVEADGLHELEIENPRPRHKDIGIPGTELLVYDDRIQVEVRGGSPVRGIRSRAASAINRASGGRVFRPARTSGAQCCNGSGKEGSAFVLGP